MVSQEKAQEALDLLDEALCYVDWQRAAAAKVSSFDVGEAWGILQQAVMEIDPVEAGAAEFADILKDM